MSMFYNSTAFQTASPAGVSEGANLVAGNSYAVTPADGIDLLFAINNGATLPTRGLRVTGAGNVSVNLFGGGTAVLTALAAGQVVTVGVTRVLATGTTATGITAVY